MNNQTGEALSNEYTVGGKLEGWRDRVSLPAVGNPVLMLAMCASFLALCSLAATPNQIQRM